MNMFEMYSCGKRHEVEESCNCSDYKVVGAYAIPNRSQDKKYKVVDKVLYT